MPGFVDMQHDIIIITLLLLVTVKTTPTTPIPYMDHTWIKT